MADQKIESSPLNRVLLYFEGASEALAVAALRSYYAPNHHWTGSAFDRLTAGTPADVFTADDILAVTMLSVDVPPRAALALLDDRDVRDLLTRIPSAASLWDQPEVLARDGFAWRLWDLVDGLSGVGPTIASKILAAKRPRLIPIYDQHVARALHPASSQWAFWQSVAHDPGAEHLQSLVQGAMKSAGVPHYVCTLRAIDVVVWMREHGWTTHDARECQQGCDFACFDPSASAPVSGNPQCANCNRPLSFHGQSRSRCQVGACGCEQFVYSSGQTP